MNKVIHIIENGKDKGTTDKYCKKVKLDKDYDAKMLEKILKKVEDSK